jgi:hypothetical protein
MLIVTCTTLAVLTGVWVLAPLFREPGGNLAVDLLAETELDRLLNRKAVVYSNLKELEFEYKIGRLSDDDYRRLENGYKLEAAAILKQLDGLGVEKDLDESIESEIAARKTGAAPARAQASARTESCPQCGAEVIPGKKFCADCGRRL